MQWIALTACPGTPRPDNRFTRNLLGDFRDSLVVAQRIEIVFVKTGPARSIQTVVRRAFTKIYFDRAHPKFQQTSQLVLVPLDGCWVAKVERGIFVGTETAGIAHRQPVIDDLGKETVLAGEIGVLPEADMKPIPFQVGNHLRGIMKSGGRKLVVGAPISFKPAGVEMDHVGGDPILPQLGSDIAYFVLSFVRDAAHPEAERP